MFVNEGYQWAGSILGFLAVLLVPIPFILAKYGRALRLRSPWAKQHMDDLNEEEDLGVGDVERAENGGGRGVTRKDRTSDYDFWLPDLVIRYDYLAIVSDNNLSAAHLRLSLGEQFLHPIWLSGCFKASPRPAKLPPQA